MCNCASPRLNLNNFINFIIIRKCYLIVIWKKLKIIICQKKINNSLNQKNKKINIKILWNWTIINKIQVYKMKIINKIFIMI